MRITDGGFTHNEEGTGNTNILWKQVALLLPAPDLPGCVATADTLDKIKQLMREGIAFHVEGMREDGVPIPEPTTVVTYAEVA